MVFAALFTGFAVYVMQDRFAYHTQIREENIKRRLEKQATQRRDGR